MMNRVSGALETEITSLKDSNRNLLNSLREDLIKVLKDGFHSAGKASKEYIRDLESMKKDSANRFKTFFKRWEILDYIIVVDLIITPILFVIVLYLMHKL